ncbi:MAG: 16S rRNA processing protein RimM [Nitrospirae bacterium]|nr:MAG: 16S rRNA processing protein RimM [Nitrospirota bacterium]
MSATTEVVIGVIIGVKGIRGEVKATPYVTSLERFNTVDTVVLELSSGRRLKVTLEEWYPYKKWIVIKFQEIKDRQMAETLKGAEIKVPAETSPQLPEGQYYYCQLIGMRVETLDGRFVGVLEDIMETGANDVYVVRGSGGTEYLIPAVEKFIKLVDLENNIMKIDPVEGILEVYEKEGG